MSASSLRRRAKDSSWSFGRSACFSHDPRSRRTWRKFVREYCLVTIALSKLHNADSSSRENTQVGQSTSPVFTVYERLISFRWSSRTFQLEKGGSYDKKCHGVLSIRFCHENGTRETTSRESIDTSNFQLGKGASYDRKNLGKSSANSILHRSCLFRRVLRPPKKKLFTP